jgi:hypothetical protein
LFAINSEGKGYAFARLHAHPPTIISTAASCAGNHSTTASLGRHGAAPIGRHQAARADRLDGRAGSAPQRLTPCRIVPVHTKYSACFRVK